MNTASTFSRRVGWMSVLLALLCSVAFSQSRTIRGKVTDARDNTPLPGVTVKIVNATTGTVTGADGAYSISVPSASSRLEFSFIGYETLTLPAGASGTLDVGLPLSSKNLEDVVVVGYGTLKKKEITNAVTSLRPENFNAGVARSPLDLIQGKVPGLSITRANGTNPNGGATFQMRGITSLNGSQEPLIVIDGVPGGNLDLLQQEDIASVDVLRDGSAAAIYGTRGNGGVILITTKKGRGGAPQFNLATFVQRDYVAKKPRFLTADEFRKIAPNADEGGNTDVYDMLLNKDNLSQYYTLSATGGNEKSNYRAAVYYNKGEGIAKRNYRDQYGGRINVNQTGVNGRLVLQSNLSVNFNKADLLGGNNGDFEQAVQRNPTSPLMKDGKYVNPNGFNVYNPIARLEQELYYRDQQTLQGDAKLSFEVIKDLRASVFGGITRNTYNDRQFRTKDSKSSVDSYEGRGYAYKGNYLSLDKTLDVTLDYFKRIDKHQVTAVAGYSYFNSTYETFNMNNSGFLTDGFQDWNMGNGLFLREGKAGMGSYKAEHSLVAFFARANYAFNDKYFAQAIFRYEGSTRFGKDNKWAKFPSISAGWNLHEEHFIKSTGWVDQLKLRVGYGETGNSGFANYNSLTLMSTGGAYPLDGRYPETVGLSRNPNPRLGWETKSEWNFGLDFSLFNNRLGGSFDVYRRTTGALLGNYDVPLPSNVNDKMWYNLGSIRNKGFEIVLNAVPVQKRNFTYSTDITFNRQNNTMTKISGPGYRIEMLTFGGLPSPGNLGPAIRVVEGSALGNFYGKRFAGFTAEGDFLFYKKDGSTGKAGDIKEEDLSVIGNGVPKMMISWNNNLRYKNWDLTMFWRGKLGVDLLNLQDMYFGNRSWLPNNLLKVALTKHAQVKVPPQYSDYYLEPGGFVKLDNVTIGYKFPVKSGVIRQLRAYVSGRNLATITKYSGLDPELQDNGMTTGIDNRGFYPRTRSFTVGINLGF
ncbi:SusC/RagA family TonB-linked outer membrane protein [Chitinophaga rhizosphaerae]|uniref:SusC/RagA family TonB-linked outer membrane protein n=1 Tax=Chitinophaga rhizosphaerae TaxID=1864947 RepID=UPI00196B847E|nr:SusC/RagA family TonB-linked outer membrane protein [Chitinophaga rhizosphaerae]